MRGVDVGRNAGRGHARHLLFALFQLARKAFALGDGGPLTLFALLPFLL